MRIGLLQCDHVRERYLPIAGDYDDMFRAMVAAVDPDAEVVVYDARNGELPGGPDECDAWLLTGSSASVYDDEPWITSLSAFVRTVHEARAPTVGICFGHQLLAHALGGRTERAAGGWGVGALPMTVSDAADWMAPAAEVATLLYSHQDQVTRLPPGGRLLATASHCPVAMLAVGDDAVGVQAHPEFSAPYLRALLDDRVDRIGEAGAAEAVASLVRPTDDRTVAAWLLTFLRRRVAARVETGTDRAGTRGSEPPQEAPDMGKKTDQDTARKVGDRLAPPTTPDKDTIREDRDALDTEHGADRAPTPEEEAAAERRADSADGEVSEHYEDMLERGAAQEGEGKPGI